MSITTLYRETCQELLKIGDSESFTIERATKGYYANHPDCFSMIPADFANYVLIKCKIYLNEVVIGLSEKYDIMPELSNSQDGIESEKKCRFYSSAVYCLQGSQPITNHNHNSELYNTISS